jgi:dethiobiotin synthetase
LRGLLVIVTGVGTAIGKTHVAEALLHAWGRRSRVTGLKPIESGVEPGVDTDAARLARASTFHVKQQGIALRAPLSPHLAARRENVAISVPEIVRLVDDAREAAEGVLVELPGGLFTPIADDALNLDLALRLRADVTLLVAPDRLGVLHDTISAVRAATSALRIDAVLLVAPDQPDASTGTNAAEIERHARIAVAAVLPRAPPDALSILPAVERLVASWIGHPQPIP